MIKDFTYFNPVRIVFGPGKLKETGSYAKQYGKKALIITTGDFFKTNGLIDRLQKILKDSGVDSVAYTAVSPNPLTPEVDAAADFGKKNGCDLIIGLGGGSSIDAAKGVAVTIGHNAKAWDYYAPGSENVITDKTLPIIAITTTSGTGSHVTPYAVMTNPDTKEKPGVGSDYTYAKVAVVDPELMLTVPSRVTAATGFDVYAHSLEAYASSCSTPMTDMMAEQAIRLVGKYLRTAVNDGSNLEARAALAYADTLAGICIAVAGTSACHSIAHAVGGVCETVHGEALAAMTPHTMRFNMKANPQKYINVAIFLRGEQATDDVRAKYQPENSVQEVEKLLQDIGMNIPLGKQNVTEADLQEIADGAASYMGGGLTVEAEMSKDDVIDILKKSL